VTSFFCHGAQNFVHPPTEQTNVRTGNACRLLPRLCLARAPTLPPCTRARCCSRRARRARCSRRTRARASPRMRATNDALRLLPRASPLPRLCLGPATASPRPRHCLAYAHATHAARVAHACVRRRFGLTSLGGVARCFCSQTQNDERDDDERDDDERDEQDEREEVPDERVRARAP